MNEEKGVQGQMVDTWIGKRCNDAAVNERKRTSERDATRKDGTKNDDTVEGLGGGNFVDATFPAGERRSLTGHRTERASGQKRSPKLPETAVTTRYDVRARGRLLSNVNTV